MSEYVRQGATQNRSCIGRPQTGPSPQPPGGPVRSRAAEGGLRAVARHAAARHPVEEPGDVRGRGRDGADLHLHGRQALRLYRPPPPVAYLLWLGFLARGDLLFANFASAIAEARGKAQADALRKDAPRQLRPGRSRAGWHHANRRSRPNCMPATAWKSMPAK